MIKMYFLKLKCPFPINMIFLEFVHQNSFFSKKIFIRIIK